MIADHLIEILRCPLDRSELHRASADLVAKLNLAVAAGTLKNVAGEGFEKPLDGGLIRAAGDLLYPIIDEIPVMLPDEAIDLGAFN
ncbi:MAG: hypothetical protein JNL18_03635 [Planctomycetaceae bacterium]|jgi:uncharacterized protein YbaR (Trm112 family)|nr:hypothetical protein [Planctomycetaceae bacterium]